MPTPEKFLYLNLKNLGAKTIEETGYNRPPGCSETQVQTLEKEKIVQRFIANGYRLKTLDNWVRLILRAFTQL